MELLNKLVLGPHIPARINYQVGTHRDRVIRVIGYLEGCEIPDIVLGCFCRSLFGHIEKGGNGIEPSEQVHLPATPIGSTSLTHVLYYIKCMSLSG